MKENFKISPICVEKKINNTFNCYNKLLAPTIHFVLFLYNIFGCSFQDAHAHFFSNDNMHSKIPNLPALL